MHTSAQRLRIVRHPLTVIGLFLASLLVCGLLGGFVLAGGAQAAVTYNAEELAFVNQLNQYRSAQGLKPLLLSDKITEACDRHGSDMGKYAFFSHYSLKSDYFAYNATPWDRMAESGYDYYTSKAENIAAGQCKATDVFTAWKNSPGHDANMLGSAYTVIGVSQVTVPGSPYTYYWVTDFGGYVDSTAHAPGQPAPSPVPTTTRYQQTDSRLVYAGTWSTFTTSGASGGSYKRASAGSASVTVTFRGSYLAWVATKGTTLSKAYVSLDGGAAQVVDLARSSVAYQQKVWNTGVLSSGTHTVKIWRNPYDTAGKYISVDAFEIEGTLQAPVVAASPTTRYEQTDSHFRYSGTWANFSRTAASGGSYGRSSTPGASVTVTFSGTHLVWIATAGTTLGRACVSVDGGPTQYVNLARSAVAYQQKVWETGDLVSGKHTVKIWRDTNNAAGKYISVDAFEIEGTLS
jgi:hypothetical protein